MASSALTAVGSNVVGGANPSHLTTSLAPPTTLTTPAAGEKTSKIGFSSSEKTSKIEFSAAEPTT